MSVIDECLQKRQLTTEYIQKIGNRKFDRIANETGEERVVTYTIDEVWDDYLFILNGVIYRWDNCNKLINEIKKYIKQLSDDKEQGKFFIVSPQPITDNLSYEFENLIVAFPRLYDETLLVEIGRHITKSNVKKIRSDSIKRENIRGLYWELNLLRNRAAHSTPGYYTMNEGMAARYLSISSKIRTIEVDNGECIFNSSLISYRKNGYIQKVIEECFVQKKYGEEISKKPIMELLFESTTPKGKGKKEPQMLFMSNVDFFDMNKEFYELSSDMFDYLIIQLEVFDDEV